ncbi:MAG: hypothetical protein K2Y71_17290 [Xanthobacteraceae bacterium]|nr:hypothetical protein [Xanthobacteraceae bacterium]
MAQRRLAPADLLGKRVDFQVDTPAALMPLIKEGKLRAIAITGPNRFFVLPDAPAISGTVKGYAVTSWLGLAGPPGLPSPFVNRVNAEVKTILSEPTVIERLRDLGSDARPTTPEGFRERVADDVAKWTKVVADAKVPKV